MSDIGTKRTVEAAIRLGTLIDAHARDAGRQLGETLRPWLEDGETLPDYALALELPARMIAQAGRHLRECQNRLDEARSHDREARDRRDQTASALHRKLVEIRRLVASALGLRRTATLLGFEGKTADKTQPARLLSQAEAYLRLLHEPRRLAIPRADLYFEPAAIASALEPLAGAFREAGGQLDEVRRASAASLEARDRARAQLEHAIRHVVRFLGGWFVLVGRPDLAEKIQLVQLFGQGRLPWKTTNSSKKEVPM